jgi:predicted nucleotidyltransferase
MTELPHPDALREIVADQPDRLLFATVSGAHLYGFESPDSDVDLRGCHVLPLEQVVGLFPGSETRELMGKRPDLELDLVTHDVGKFLRMLLKPNGYVLEQLTSPLVAHTTPEHEELLALVPQLVTRRHHGHYLGFSNSQWRLLEKEDPPRLKPLLYAYRVLATGIHLMRTGEVEANLARLDELAPRPGVDELIARKREGAEKEPLEPGEAEHHRAVIEDMQRELKEAHDASTLPERPTAQAALHDLLVRVRTQAREEPGAAPAATSPRYLRLDADAEALREAFEEDVERTRVLVLAAPT